MHVRFWPDYACVVWHPPQKYLVKRSEKLNNQAACFVTRNWDPFASISVIKSTLIWEPLQPSRKKLRFKFLHCIYYNGHGSVAIMILINLFDFSVFQDRYADSKRSDELFLVAFQCPQLLLKMCMSLWAWSKCCCLETLNYIQALRQHATTRRPNPQAWRNYQAMTIASQ